MNVMFPLFGGVAGAAAGSFVNAAFDRLRRGESIVYPPSHCDACRTPLRVADNVPVVSWLLLRGRCRVCRARIPLRTLAIETAGAVAGAIAATSCS